MERGPQIVTNGQWPKMFPVAELWKVGRFRGTVQGVNAGSDFNKLPGAGDDGFNRPTVTPVPAPPDDQLIRMAKVGTIVGAIATVVIARWLHKHIQISWR